MILQLGIPGQLAAVKTTVSSLVESGTVTSLPCGGAQASLAGSPGGLKSAAAVTSSSYIDAVSVSGRGILYVAAIACQYASTTTTGYLQVEIDGTLTEELSVAATVSATQMGGFAVGVGNYLGLAAPGAGTGALLVPVPVPYRTGFKLKVKRTSGNGSVTPYYLYVPFNAAA